jgi:hypothetical protein
VSITSSCLRGKNEFELMNIKAFEFKKEEKPAMYHNQLSAGRFGQGEYHVIGVLRVFSFLIMNESMFQ